MKSVYERLLNRPIEIDRETLDMILSDYEKIIKRQNSLVDGRLKTKQIYPHLNDLITRLKEVSK